MNNIQSTLAKILQNNKSYEREKVRNVIILYEEQRLYIGDSLIRFHYLKGFKQFFPQAKLSLNFLNKDFQTCYHALLQNNPYLDHLYNLKWEEIPFDTYDIVICLTHNELNLLKHLYLKYGIRFLSDQLQTCIFSISREIVPDGEQVKFAFPKYEEFFIFFSENTGDDVREIFITEKERHFGEIWLRENGLKSDEQIFVIVDSTSKRYKLMGIAVYLNFLKSLLSIPKSKVLIFDENAIGKREFYLEILGEQLTSKIIFSTSNELRQDLNIMSASAVKMIFGPCTGLLHCASGIYNHFAKNGMTAAEIPLIITYTGKYRDGNRNANNWWSNSPLVDCLMLRSVEGETEMVLLNELSLSERDLEDNQVECSDYTADMFINFIQSRLASKLF